jgi:tetratricopeptide (TPR) repeat protein
MAERGSDGSLRYRMLEPVREYGLASLSSTPEHGEILNRHAAWFTLQAAEHEARRAGAVPLGAGLSVIDAEIADHRAAMRHLLDVGDPSSAASIASSLSHYWYARYLGWEAVRWLSEALAGGLVPETRVRALWAAAWAAYTRADYAVATDWYRECLELADSLGDRAMIARSLYGLGRIQLPREGDEGRRLTTEALATAEAVSGLEELRAECLLALGFTEATRGCHEAAVPLLDEAASVFGAGGHLRSVSVCHRYLSLAAWYRDDESMARLHVDLAEEFARKSVDLPAVSGALIQRALVESKWGSTGRAARAVIEALEPVPIGNEIDFCLILFAAFPVLLASGRLEVARELFAHLDRVYAEYGWAPLDERSPYAAALRSQVEDGAAAGLHAGEHDPRPSSGMAAEVVAVLATMAEDESTSTGVGLTTVRG